MDASDYDSFASACVVDQSGKKQLHRISKLGKPTICLVWCKRRKSIYTINAVALEQTGEEQMGQNKLSGQEFRTSLSLKFSIKALFAVTILVATFFAGRVSMQNKVKVLENEMIESNALIDKLNSDHLQLVDDVAKTRNRILELTNRQFQKQNNQRDE